jgi:hypothetical protein
MVTYHTHVTYIGYVGTVLRILENHITAHNHDNTESAQQHVEQMGETQAKRLIPEMWEKAPKKLVRYFPDGDGRHDADLASALLYLVLAHSSQTLKGYTETGISKSCSRPIITLLNNVPLI